MANTVIKLKKSSVPSEVPVSLEYGELAINYADGKLFYKDNVGSIQQITSGGASFGTINVNNSLIVSGGPSAVLGITNGDNIELSADIINDILTISANLKPAYDVANAAFNKANVGGGSATINVGTSAPVSPNVGSLWWNTTSGRLFIYYTDNDSSQWVETSPSGGVIDYAAISANILPTFNSAFNTANAAYDKANASNVLAYNTGIGANAYSDVVGTSANSYAGAMANAANAYAASLTPDLTPAFNQANAAFDKANSANVLAYETGIGANAYTVMVGASGNAYVNVSTDSANNYAGSMANSANAYAASLTPDLSPAFNKANAAYTNSNGAFDAANTALKTNSFSTINVSGSYVDSSLANDVLNITTDGSLNISTNTVSKTINFAIASTIDYGLVTGAVTATNDYGSLF